MIYSKLQLWDSECCDSDTLRFNPDGLREITMWKNWAEFLILCRVFRIYNPQKL